MQFKDVLPGLFRYNGIVYTKISDTQAVLITSGKIVNFDPSDIVESY